uniref:F-box domain-containing protein n=1 Tax=Panagrolaimus sp. ES5 TaxID=591445 RepID=A0AC34FDE9_9BILA
MNISSGNDCPILRLPTEILDVILKSLDETDTVSSALVCQKWKELTNHMHHDLDELRFFFSWNDVRLLANSCACVGHQSEQCVMIRELFDLKGFNAIRCLHLEDEMPKPNDGIPDSYMNIIMHKLNKNVETLQLTNLDLSFINVLTFAGFANFRNITHLVFVDCSFPSDLDQHKFIKSITPILPMVENLEITGTPFVNDQFGFALAKFGFSLANVNLQRCQNISAITIASFCTCTGSDERKRPIVFDLHSTKFNVDDLDRILHHPVLRQEKLWEVNLADLRHLTGRITVTVTNSKDNGYTVFY